MYGVISSKTRKLTKLYGAISSKTRAISKIYSVVGGVTKLVYQSKGKPRMVHISADRVNYSDDLGVTWTTVTGYNLMAEYSGVNNRYRSVIYHDGILLCGYDRFIYKSLDYGVTWSSYKVSTHSSNYQRTELAYCESTGYYLALHVSPDSRYWYMYVSTDATTWSLLSYSGNDMTSGSYGSSHYIHHITQANGKILFSFQNNANGYIIIECDGKTCTVFASNVDTGQLPFAYYNGNYFGIQYNTTLKYSSDWKNFSGSNYTYASIASYESSQILMSSSMNVKMTKVSDSIYSFGNRGINWVYGSDSYYPWARDIDLDTITTTEYFKAGYFKSFGYVSYDGIRYFVLDNINGSSAVSTRYVFKQSGTSFTQIGNFPINYKSGNDYTPSNEQTIIIEI